MHAGRHQNVTFKVHEPQVTVRPDVHVLVNARARLRQEGAELDGCRHGTAMKRVGEKRAPQVLPWYSRDDAEQLGRTLQRAVATDDACAYPIRRPQRPTVSPYVARFPPAHNA